MDCVLSVNSIVKKYNDFSLNNISFELNKGEIMENIDVYNLSILIMPIICIVVNIITYYIFKKKDL